MKIAEITAEPILHGGQEVFIANLVSNIDDPDITIDVVTPHICDNNAFRDLVKSRGGRIIELNLPFMPGKSRRLLLEPLTEFLNNNSYDVVHAHSGSISALAYIAKAAGRAKVGKIIVHSHSTGTHSLKHTIIKNLFGITLRKNATDYLACSYEAGAAKYPPDIVKKKLVVVRNGVPVNRFIRNTEKRDYQRRLLGIPEDAFVIGHVGRFAKEKNHSFLIELFDEYSKTSTESRLLLVGDGEKKREIEQLVNGKGLKEQVLFTGNVDNVQDYYQAMDVFVLPSIYEGFSYATLEAQAAGVPCIISAGVPKAVMLGKNIERISLEDKSKWIESLNNTKEKGVNDNTAAIKNAGYDAADTAVQVLSVYKDNN